MATLANAVAGPYTCTHDGASVGITREGFILTLDIAKQAVVSDYYGDSIIDSVHRGGNATLTWVGIEYTKAVAVLTGHQFASMLQPGKLDLGSALYKGTTLTAASGTTASLNPATLSSTHSVVAQEQRTQLEFAARLRTVPITLRLYPYESSPGTIIWFATT